MVYMRQSHTGLWKDRTLEEIGTIILVFQLILAGYVNRPWLPIDARIYLGLAQQMAHLSYSLPTPFGVEPSPYRTPGFPAFLAVLLDVLKLPYLVVLALFGSAYLLSIRIIANCIFGKSLERNIFLCLTIIYLFPVFYVMSIATEGIAIPLIALLAVQLTSVTLTWRRLFLIGLLGGLVSIVRPDALPTLIVPTIVVFWRGYSRGDLSRTPLVVIAKAGFSPTITLLLMSPFAFWNLHNFDKFSMLPVASGSGKSLYIATWDGVLTLQDLGPLVGTAMQPQPASKRAIDAGLEREVNEITRSANTIAAENFPTARYLGATRDMAYDQQYSAKAMVRIKKNPGQYALHILRGSWNMWNTQEYPSALPTLARYALKVVSGVFLVLALVGAFLTICRRLNMALSRVPLLIIAVYVLIHLPFHTEARYTAPVRLLMLVYAAALLATVGRRLFSRFTTQQQDTRSGVSS